MVHPDNDDVVVRRKHVNPSTVYVLSTSSTPEQFTVPTRDEAVAQALAFARGAQVRAWFDNGDSTFVLLGTFRLEETAESAGAS
jgi:protein involved in polysaccharide export with SLBB domain